MVLGAPATGRRLINSILPGQQQSSATLSCLSLAGSVAQRQAGAAMAEVAEASCGTAAEAVETALTCISIKVKMSQDIL